MPQNRTNFPAGTPFTGITFAAGSPAYNLQATRSNFRAPSPI